MNKKNIANTIINELRSDYHSFEEISDLATHFSVDGCGSVSSWACEPRFVKWDECDDDFEEWLSGRPGVHTCLQYLGVLEELPDGCQVSDLCFEVGLLE